MFSIPGSRRIFFHRESIFTWNRPGKGSAISYSAMHFPQSVVTCSSGFILGECVSFQDEILGIPRRIMSSEESESDLSNG